jgi:CDGSH-type Zn-finger protein
MRARLAHRPARCQGSTGLALKLPHLSLSAIVPCQQSITTMIEPVIYQKSPIVQKVTPGTFWWCACGRSKTQPFCDGTHKGTGLGPKQTEITEAGTVAWCACKHSQNAPFCDGTHAKL